MFVVCASCLCDSQFKLSMKKIFWSRLATPGNGRAWSRQVGAADAHNAPHILSSGKRRRGYNRRWDLFNIDYQEKDERKAEQDLINMKFLF